MKKLLSIVCLLVTSIFSGPERDPKRPKVINVTTSQNLMFDEQKIARAPLTSLFFLQEITYKQLWHCHRANIPTNDKDYLFVLKCYQCITSEMIRRTAARCKNELCVATDQNNNN